MVITPFSMDLNLQSSGLSIADLTPYISQYSSAHVTQGTFSNKGELKLNLAKDVSFSYSGNADVASLNVTDKQGAELFRLRILPLAVLVFRDFLHCKFHLAPLRLRRLT